MLGSEPTTAEKIRKLHWNTALSAANTVFVNFTFFGSAFVLFLSALRFTNSEIGFLLSLFPFFGLIALFIAPVVGRVGYKRVFVTFFGVRKFVTALLLLVPAVTAAYGAQAALPFVTLIVMGFALCRAISETAIFPWAQEYIPNAIRGKYSAVNDIVSRFVGMAAIAVGGFIIDQSAGLNGFMILFAIGVVFGLIAVWTATHIPGGAPMAQSEARRTSYRELFHVLRDPNFTSYVAGLGVITVASVPMLSFLPLYMERQIGLAESQVVLLQVGTLVGGLSATYLAGWAADRYGSKPVMMVGVYLKILLPVLWLVMPRSSPLSLAAALVIAALFGAAEIAWAIGAARLLFVRVVPAEKKTEYMAVYYAAMGIIGGVSQLAGGWLLDLSGGISGQIAGIIIDPFTPLFVLGLLLTVFSVVIFRRVQADSDVSVGSFAGMFIHGNPFMALESMVRYYRAKDEHATVVMTERLGQTKSPLTVDELLEGLRDPRFNVRIESIISIARMNSDPRLVNALCQILDGTELSLSVIAAWALGRMGDESALPTLREGVDSEYRSIRAHCVRALGTLGDKTMTPMFQERLKMEEDKGLRIAYAAALGNLKATDAVETLFMTLRATENEGARMELALSIARLMGQEQHFIRLLRHLRQDPGTAMAQAVAALRKRLTREDALTPELEAAVRECDALFAREAFDEGAARLSRVIRLLPAGSYDELCTKILNDCAVNLDEFGAARLEFVLLALHALEAG